MTTIVNLNEGNFEDEVLKSSSLVLLILGRMVCTKNLTPILEEISVELKEKLRLQKLI